MAYERITKRPQRLVWHCKFQENKDEVGMRNTGVQSFGYYFSWENRLRIIKSVRSSEAKVITNLYYQMVFEII